ncbi:hypothetical protein NW757_013253 [Fusarium falciforme]|nr:hypothetical protein NW757_013253 [Fusarium falciforme]
MEPSSNSERDLHESNGPAGQKRQWELSPAELSQKQPQCLPVSSRAEKRHRSSCGAEDSSPKLSTLVVHRVQCHRAMSGHERHSPVAMYLDRPQLFRGDSRASALRGQHGLRSIEDYTGARKDVSLVIVRRYNCESYHEAVRDAFVQVPQPNSDPEVPAELHPYFDILRQPVEPAVAFRESIQITQSLREAMDVLVARDPALFAEWEASLVPPYLHIYHTRARMRTLTGEIPDTSRASHIVQLLDYVEESFGREYREADNLFSQGLVTKDHIHKLFGPNEVIVAFDEGEPVGFVSMTFPAPPILPFSLKCYTWTFDGRFRKEEKSLNIQWPSKDNGPLAITALGAYPLQFDPTGKLEKALRDRGTMFWSCRKRAFVGYDAPIASFKIQVVR